MMWEKVRLSGVCDSITDGTHQAPPKALLGVPFVTISCFEDNSINYSDTEFISEDFYDSLDDKRKAKVGDILYSVVGTFGKSALIKEDKKFVFQRHIAILRPAHSINGAFLYYILASKNFYTQADQVALGSAQRTISLRNLRNMEIDLPPRPVQDKIATILSAYDDMIANCKRQIALLEEAAQRLYREWFVDMRFPGHETAPLNENGLPEDWTQKKLKDISHICMGQSPASEFYNQDGIGLPFHQGVVGFGKRFVSTDVYASQFNKTAQPNSILFSVRAPVGRLNITSEKIAIGRGLAAIQDKRGYQSFLWYALSNIFYKKDIIGNGTIFSSITKAELENIQILCPSEKLIEQFEIIIKSYDTLIINTDAVLRYCTSARDLLLPRLISGEIEIKP